MFFKSALQTEASVISATDKYQQQGAEDRERRKQRAGVVCTVKNDQQSVIGRHQEQHFHSVFSAADASRNSPQEALQQSPHRQHRKLLAVTVTFRMNDSRPTEPGSYVCLHETKWTWSFFGVLIMLMQNMSKITGASSHCGALINNSPLCSGWSHLGPLGRRKYWKDYCKNLKTLLLPLLCF